MVIKKGLTKLVPFSFVILASCAQGGFSPNSSSSDSNSNTAAGNPPASSSGSATTAGGSTTTTGGGVTSPNFETMDYKTSIPDATIDQCAHQQPIISLDTAAKMVTLIMPVCTAFGSPIAPAAVPNISGVTYEIIDGDSIAGMANGAAVKVRVPMAMFLSGVSGLPVGRLPNGLILLGGGATDLPYSSFDLNLGNGRVVTIIVYFGVGEVALFTGANWDLGYFFGMTAGLTLLSLQNHSNVGNFSLIGNSGTSLHPGFYLRYKMPATVSQALATWLSQP